MSDVQFLKLRLQARIRFLESTLNPEKRDLYIRTLAMIEALQIALDDIELTSNRRRAGK